jgi:hypothetical protein
MSGEMLKLLFNSCICIMYNNNITTKLTLPPSSISAELTSETSDGQAASLAKIVKWLILRWVIRIVSFGGVKIWIPRTRGLWFHLLALWVTVISGKRLVLFHHHFYLSDFPWFHAGRTRENNCLPMGTSPDIHPSALRGAVTSAILHDNKKLIWSWTFG